MRYTSHMRTLHLLILKSIPHKCWVLSALLSRNDTVPAEQWPLGACAERRLHLQGDPHAQPGRRHQRNVRWAIVTINLFVAHLDSVLYVGKPTSLQYCQPRLRPDGMAKWVECPSPILRDQGDSKSLVGTLVESKQWLKNWYLSFPSQVLGIARIGNWWVGSV